MSFAATAFDRPAAHLAVPGTLTGGTRPELRLADGLTRGDQVVGRFETSPGLFAVKLAPVRDPVRVTVRFAADADTATWWERRVPEHVAPRTPYGPRLLAIRSQGATRGAVLLARRPEDFGWRSRTRISFELRPDELPDDGFLVVEAVDVPPAGPPWATPPARHGAVGVRVDAVDVAPVAPRAPTQGPSLDGSTGERLGLVGTGGSGNAAAMDVRAGFFLVRPGATPGPMSWTLRPRLVSVVRPDPIPAVTGPVVPKPAPGESPLTVRDKAVAVARHELGAMSDRVRARVRHAAARGWRRVNRPVDESRAPRLATGLLAHGRIEAVLVELDDAHGPRPCAVTAGAGGLVTVTCAEPPPGPAVVYVGGSFGPRLHWRLVSVRYGETGGGRV